MPPLDAVIFVARYQCSQKENFLDDDAYEDDNGQIFRELTNMLHFDKEALHIYGTLKWEEVVVLGQAIAVDIVSPVRVLQCEGWC